MRESYPVIFGQTLNFTLPPTEEGVSILAELDGTPMVFPLGPDLLPELGHLHRENQSRGGKVDGVPVRTEARVRVQGVGEVC